MLRNGTVSLIFHVNHEDAPEALNALRHTQNQPVTLEITLEKSNPVAEKKGKK